MSFIFERIKLIPSVGYILLDQFEINQIESSTTNSRITTSGSGVPTIFACDFDSNCGNYVTFYPAAGSYFYSTITSYSIPQSNFVITDVSSICKIIFFRIGILL